MAKDKFQLRQAIISTAINFQTAEDVKAYQGLDWKALPEDDREYNEVTRYIVGFKNVILLGLNGRRLCTVPRRSVKGLAIDGQPVIVHGPNFKRLGIEDPDTAQAAGDDPAAVGAGTPADTEGSLDTGDAETA